MDIKVSLTVILEGAVMYSKKECSKVIKREVVKKNYRTGKVYKKIVSEYSEDTDMMNKNTLTITDRKGKNPETITFYTRKSKPATQCINICPEAYNYMTSNECPEWCRDKKRVWSKLTARQRLEQHLEKIAEQLGGKVLNYKIFDE